MSAKRVLLVVLVASAVMLAVGITPTRARSPELAPLLWVVTNFFESL